MDSEGIKEIWKEYIEKLLNEENVWDQVMDSEGKEGPEYTTTKEEVIRTLRKMRHGKAAGQSGVVNEMLKASGEVGIN